MLVTIANTVSRSNCTKCYDFDSNHQLHVQNSLLTATEVSAKMIDNGWRLYLRKENFENKKENVQNFIRVLSKQCDSQIVFSNVKQWCVSL